MTVLSSVDQHGAAVSSCAARLHATVVVAAAAYHELFVPKQNSEWHDVQVTTVVVHRKSRAVELYSYYTFALG